MLDARGLSTNQTVRFAQLIALLALTVAHAFTAAQSPLRAFPGAEGFGAATIGGRGGRVIAVTTLADSGPGSLREALTATAPRIVVAPGVVVHGTLWAGELGSTLADPSLPVALHGQSAASDDDNPQQVWA